MTEMNLESLCKDVRKLSEEIGGYIKKERDHGLMDKIQAKGIHNFVTHVDKNAEEKLVDGLSKLLPGAGFITEEGTSSRTGDIKWVIDPLDGTTNFIHGSPPYAISIALLENEEPVLGVVFEVTANECYYTWKGAKTFLNGSIVHVSSVDKVQDSLIATGFPYENFDLLKPFMASLEHFFCNSHGVRRLGSAATDLAYVACGRYDAFYEYNLKPWDVAAGVLLIKHAGGKICDFKGGENYIYGKEIVASNDNLHEEFLNQVASFLKK